MDEAMERVVRAAIAWQDAPRLNDGHPRDRSVEDRLLDALNDYRYPSYRAPASAVSAAPESSEGGGGGAPAAGEREARMRMALEHCRDALSAEFVQASYGWSKHPYCNLCHRTLLPGDRYDGHAYDCPIYVASANVAPASAERSEDAPESAALRAPAPPTPHES